MAFDRDILSQTAEGDIPIPTPGPSTGSIAANFVEDPMALAVTAGAGEHFQGHKQARALSEL